MRGILVSDAIFTTLLKNQKRFNSEQKLNLKKMEFKMHSKFSFAGAAILKKILNTNFNDVTKTKKTLEKKYNQNLAIFKSKSLNSLEKENIDFIIMAMIIGWNAKSINESKKHVGEEGKQLEKDPSLINESEVVSIIIFMLRNNTSDNVLKKYILDNYNLDLSVCKEKGINVKKNIENKIIAAMCLVMENEKFEEAIEECFRKYKIDTTILITGIFAQAYYQKIPPYLIKRTNVLFPKHLKDLVGKMENRINDR